jgi:hypothetical protein
MAQHGAVADREHGRVESALDGQIRTADRVHAAVFGVKMACLDRSCDRGRRKPNRVELTVGDGGVLTPRHRLHVQFFSHSENNCNGRPEPCNNSRHQLSKN